MKLIRLPLKKEMSLGTWTLKRPKYPETLYVPVYVNAPFYQTPCVVPEQLVSTGARLAEPRSSSGIRVFSPANGVVSAITRMQTASGEDVLAVEIQVDKKNPFSFFPSAESSDWMEATSEKLCSLIRGAGIVLNGKISQPLARVLEKGPFHKKALIVNACESEPYITSAQVLLLSHPLEILKGVEILRRAAGMKEALITLSSDAEQAAEVLKSKIYFLKWEHIRVQVFPSRYPQDEPSVLFPAIDPELSALSPSQFQNWPLINIAAVYAAYEAIVLRKPFFERVITVTGECVVAPQNLLLPIGMTVADAVKACKGMLREPGRMIAGGPMRGRIVAMLEPVSAATEALVALPKEHSAQASAIACIRCGACADFCPSDLSPALIAMAAEESDYKRARELRAGQCVSCGNCAYVCPSHIPLVEMITGCS